MSKDDDLLEIPEAKPAAAAKPAKAAPAKAAAKAKAPAKVAAKPAKPAKAAPAKAAKAKAPAKAKKAPAGRGAKGEGKFYFPKDKVREGLASKIHKATLGKKATTKELADKFSEPTWKIRLAGKDLVDAKRAKFERAGEAGVLSIASK